MKGKEIKERIPRTEVETSKEELVILTSSWSWNQLISIDAWQERMHACTPQGS